MKALELATLLESDTADELLCQAYCDHMIDAAAELRRLAAVESDCAQYLKEGETPSERIKRALGDADSLMNLYRDVVAERDALKAELEGIKALEPVAWANPHGLGSISDYYMKNFATGLERQTYTVQLYALGSKTA